MTKHESGEGRLTKWYALDQKGDMVFVGEYADFAEADGSLEYSPVWLVSESAARTWLAQLQGMLTGSTTRDAGMTKHELLLLLRLLSALESWAFSLQTRLPDYLHEDLVRMVERLQEEILK